MADISFKKEICWILFKKYMYFQLNWQLTKINPNIFPIIRSLHNHSASGFIMDAHRNLLARSLQDKHCLTMRIFNNKPLSTIDSCFSNYSWGNLIRGTRDSWINTIIGWYTALLADIFLLIMCTLSSFK